MEDFMLSKRLICLSLIVITFFISNQANASQVIKIAPVPTSASSVIKFTSKIGEAITTHTPALVTGTAAACVGMGCGYSLFRWLITPSSPDSLHQAASLGNEVLVENLLVGSQKPRISELGHTEPYLGLSPLHIAIDKGHFNIVAILVANGADINLYDDTPISSYQRTPLNLAIEKGFLPIVQYLLDHGAEPEKPNIFRDGDEKHADLYPLHIAAQKGNTPIAKQLLDKKISVMRRDYSYHRLPLHWAAQHNDVELIKAFIEIPGETFYNTFDTLGLFVVSPHYWTGKIRTDQNRKKYINNKDTNGETPLVIAASKGNNFVVQYLLDNGALDVSRAIICAICHFSDNPQIYMPTLNTLLNFRDNLAEIPNALSLALEHHAPDELIRLLVSHNANRDGIAPGTNYWIDYPLHEAAEAGNLERVKRLIHSPNFHANVKDILNHTPIYWASLRGHINVVEYLLQQGAKINAEYGDQFASPLHAAASTGKEQVVLFLCKHGANVDLEDSNHETPLHTAARNGHKEVIRILLEFHAHIGHIKDNVTPLIEAILNNKQDCAKLLLDHGASASQGDPLSRAVACGQTGIVIKLLEKHAPITQQAIDAAVKASNSEIAQLLHDSKYVVEKTLHIHRTAPACEDFATAEKAAVDRWRIIPSLQQSSRSGELTQMGGYYALYNALCLVTNQEAEMRNRNKFCQYLEPALNFINSLRKTGTVENLSTAEIQQLIREQYVTFPIIAIEKKSLFIYLNQILKDLSDALEITPKNNYLIDFIEHRINKLAIIAGLGDDNGHWFTIFAERINEQVVLKIADSAHKVFEWTHDMLESNVLPFYLALMNPLANWSQVFNKTMLEELFHEFQEDEPFRLSCEAYNLQIFINNVHNLKESLIDYLETDMPQRIGEAQQILTHIRLRKFITVVTKLLPKILAQGAKLDSLDPLGDEIISLYDSIQRNLQDLHIAISKINEDEEQSISKRLQEDKKQSGLGAEDPVTVHSRLAIEEKIKRQKAVLFLTSTLRKLEANSCKIFQAINIKTVQQISAPEITDDSFISYVNDLQPELLKLILQFIPEAIVGLIGRLSKDIHDPVRALLIGQPGNGKTTIAQAIAQTSRRPFCFVRVPSLGNSFQFSRENQIKTLIDYMDKNPTAVILLDEIDAISESSNQPQRAAEQLQAILDLAENKYPKVVFIATTNYKDKIPAPLLSRFAQNILTIDNPTSKQRNSIIFYHIARLRKANLQFDLDMTYLEELVHKTEFFSIRDIESLFENVQGQISIRAGAQIIHDAVTIMPICSETQFTGKIVTREIMEKAYEAILLTITKPDSKIISLGKGILEFASTLSPLLPYANLGLSCFGTALSLHSANIAIKQSQEAKALTLRLHGDAMRVNREQAWESSRLQRQSLALQQAQQNRAANQDFNQFLQGLKQYFPTQQPRSTYLH
jgi:ankyrin repeat protein/DNA replication protein DnaC